METRILILLLLANFCRSESDFDIIGQRIISDLRRGESTLLSPLSPDGTWPDIDYRSGCNMGRSEWPAVAHLDRVLSMARSCDDDEGTMRAFGWWLEHDYDDEGCTDTGNNAPPSRCCAMASGGGKMWNPNWWWNRIGAVLRVGPICLLMRPMLDDSQIARCSKILGRSRWQGSEGANLLWMAQGTVWRGLFENNTRIVADAYKASAREASYASDGEDGIRRDGSFFQHDGVLYTGGYGLVFAKVFIALFAASSGTAYEPTAQQQEAISALILDGIRWATLEDGLIDPSVIGRGIARPGGLGISDFDHESIVAMTSGWSRHAEFANRTSPIGNRVYPSADYAVHRGSGYTVSVKGHSERVARSECINGENRLGHRLSDGAMFVHRSPESYQDVFPLWDWNMVPGITLPSESYGDNGGCGTVYDKSDEDFVGGASDGKRGVFAMQSEFSRKAWFMFDGEIVVAVAPDSSDTLMRSVLDSRVLRSDVLSSTYGEHAPMGIGRTTSRPWWITHDSIAYVVPENARGGDVGVHVVTTVPVEAPWSRISTESDEVTTKPVFAAWIEHRGPVHYIVVPDSSKLPGTLEANVIRHNSRSMQCFTNTHTNTTGIVFWEAPRTATFSDWSVTTNRPCVIVAEEIGGGRLRVTLSDPTHKLDRVSVQVESRITDDVGTLIFDLSAHDGASHTATWDDGVPNTDMSASSRLRPFWATFE